MVSLAIVMSAHNKAHYLEPLVQQLRATAPGAELVFIDDGSADGTGDILRRHADTFLRTEDVWEVLAHNAGLRATTADYVALVQDDDFFLASGWLDICVEAMRGKSIDVLGGRATGSDYFLSESGECRERKRHALNDRSYVDRTDGAIGTVPRPDGGTDHVMRSEYCAVSRARQVNGALEHPPALILPCQATVRSPLILSRRAMDRLGLLDEAFAPLTYDDHDFCLRARTAGLTVAFTTVPQLMRFGGGSASLYSDPDRRDFFHAAVRRNLATLLRKHQDFMRRQPRSGALESLGVLRFPGELTPIAQAVLAQR